MVDSIGPVQAIDPINSNDPASRKTQRSIAEAKRLLTQNHVTGSKAMRVVNMLSQAKQDVSAGKGVDAQRIAREALKIAEETSDPISPADPTAEPDDEASIPAEENREDAQTPASQAQGIDPNQPFERDTVSYADGSGDSGVSFQYSQPVATEQAPFAVRQHELSHVRRETSDAILNGQRVLASVTIHNRIDPATGERLVGGGNAHVIIFPEIKPMFPTGQKVDLTA